LTNAPAERAPTPNGRNTDAKPSPLLHPRWVASHVNPDEEPDMADEAEESVHTVTLRFAGPLGEQMADHFFSTWVDRELSQTFAEALDEADIAESIEYDGDADTRTLTINVSEADDEDGEDEQEDEDTAARKSDDDVEAA